MFPSIFLFLFFYSAVSFFFFFFNDTATTEIYTLSLHDALPICHASPRFCSCSVSPTSHTSISAWARRCSAARRAATLQTIRDRSEEHTSELQSQFHLVCRLLLEKKKNKYNK